MLLYYKYYVIPDNTKSKNSSEHNNKNMYAYKNTFYMNYAMLLSINSTEGLQ